MEICIPKGFKIGHCNSEYSGVTAIISKKGAMGGCDCRGGAPGTRETDMLRAEKMMNKVNAVVLSGGSAYGLSSTCGVVEYLKDNKIGFKAGSKIVPIVSGAVIYDLNQKEYNYPTAEMGYNACLNADKELRFGQVGAGKGATVGKIRGLKYATKSGIGAYTVKVCGINVTAIVCVNAMGDIVDPQNGNIIAGAKNNKGEFLNTNKHILEGSLIKMMLGTNTTIGCILTDAKLDKVQTNKLASISHNGLARTISPVHTDFDGDTMFCLASGHKSVLNILLLQAAVVEATEKAILNAVSGCENLKIVYDEEEE